MGNNANQAGSGAGSSHIDVRPPYIEDFTTILEIANWATRHTAATFRTEPDTLETWIDRWKRRGEAYPWLVAQGESAVLGFAMTAPLQGR